MFVLRENVLDRVLKMLFIDHCPNFTSLRLDISLKIMICARILQQVTIDGP